MTIAIATTGNRESVYKTIESVYDQNYENIILHIVSNEKALQKIKNYIDINYKNKKITNFIKETGSGFSSALNQAFNNAKNSKYFGWINDDDFLAAGSIARAVSHLEQTKAIAVFGQLEYLNDEGKKVGFNNFGKWGFICSKYGPNLTPQPGSLFQVNAVGDSDLLEPEFKYAMDLDLWLRLHKKGKFVFIKEIQAFMMWHKDALTVKGRSKALEEAYKIRKNYSKNKAQDTVIKIMWFPTKLIAYLSLRFI